MPVLVLLAVGDLAIAAAAMVGKSHTGIALVAHLLLTLSSLAVWWHCGVARRFAPVLCLAFGPVGIVAAMLAPPIGALARQWQFLGWRVRVVESTRPSYGPAGSGGAMVARLLDGRVRHPDPDSLGSLISVMRHGSLDDRRAALEAAVRSFDPRLSKVVAMALTDEDQTIRALAAAASNRLSQRLAEDRRSLANAMAADENDAVVRLRALLTDHSRFDILLSDTQRDQIGLEASMAYAVAADGVPESTDDQACLIRTLNQSWAAQDFDLIDQLCLRAARTDGLKTDPLWTAAIWWGARPCI